ncbi:MAG TPA: protein kinase [Actinophytocola sp.]|uniref:serine/threonine-protein kinase n=1 Tax=Actinophytocola sp. TaxID=1872138 RepID=UPI002DB5819E|nr:protein kinase [Actinophytocola sp.]HEU5470858.1 protein kinase [Actinophytocola sp.]
MDPRTGRVLDGRYRIGPLLGRGGMATVWAATDLRLRRTVAVKLFHRPVDDVVLSRLRVEAKLLAGLSHPGLLTVFDVSTEPEQPYLVIQLVAGRTLRSAIDRGGPIAPDAVARLGLRLAETLEYVHSRHVMHRDLKPSNVLLDRNGTCYLADFGIAMALGQARMTATGHCVGTAAYLAPEQVAGAETTPRADIYALGLVLLECLTGRPEYTGTEVEAAIARLTRPPRIPDSVPSALRAALTAMIARDPAHRADAATAVRLLRAAAGDPAEASAAIRTVVLAPVSEPSTTRLMPVSEPRRPRMSRRRMAHAAAAIAATGAALATMLSTLSGADPGAPAGPAAGQPVQVAEPPATPATAQTGATAVVVPDPAAPAAGQEQARAGPDKDRKPKSDKGKGGPEKSGRG